MIARFAVLVALSAPTVGQQYQPFPINQTHHVNQFDPVQGRLTRVDLSMNVEMAGTVKWENISDQPLPAFQGSTSSCPFIYAGGSFYGGGVGVFISGNDHGPCPGWPDLPAFDGTLDYAGLSAATVTIAGIGGGGGSSSTQFSYCCPEGTFTLDSFTGTGTVPVVIDANAIVIGTLRAAAAGTLDFLSAQVDVWGSASPSVQFTWDPFPARLCQMGTGGCPCGDYAPNGCPSSVNTDGANLITIGASSISASNFALVAFGMGSTAPCLFFQGSSATYSGSNFGDGRRCVSGVVRRLGIKQSIAGGARYPAFGGQDPPIHVRGQISAPGTFAAYQTWYRDASPTFCTAATFNLTSAVATVWTP